MKRSIRCRVSSDYTGAGSFIAKPDRMVVGTNEGVQCVPTGASSARTWETKLGSRCLGVVEGANGMLYASCVAGLHALTPDGHQRWGAHSFKQIVYAPVPFREGVVFASRDAVHYKEEWAGSEWRFEFREVLGESVHEVRIVNLFAMEAYVVAGVVDYDSGVGRVIVLHGKTGRRIWMSEPGPLSEVFPAGKGVFVWSQTGYNRFETRLTRLDGYEIWHKWVAGVGAARSDGSIAMVVGSNESPAWDDWEYQQFSPGGKPERCVRAHGRSIARPLCTPDGSVYFVSTIFPIDPWAAKAQDTRFFHMSQEILFKHLMGIRLQSPVHQILLHRLPPNGGALDVIYRASNTFSFGELKSLEGAIVFCDGPEIIVMDA